MDWRIVAAHLLDMRFLGLFWIFVYGVGVITVRYVVVFLETGQRQRRTVPVLCAAGFAFLALVIYQGPALLAGWSVGPPGFSYAIVFAVWMGLLCTLWAALDGMFVLYVKRIHDLVAARLSGGGRPRTQRRGLIIALLFAGLLSAYAVYFTNAVSVCLRRGLDPGDLMNLTFFYARLAYVFWILFEGLLTVVTFRIWRLLRQAPAAGM